MTIAILFDGHWRASAKRGTGGSLRSNPPSSLQNLVGLLDDQKHDHVLLARWFVRHRTDAGR